MKPRFKSKDDYIKWCENKIMLMYYYSIAMNNDGIKSELDDIRSKFHLSSDEYLYDTE